MHLPLNQVLIFDDLVPKWLQDYLELITLGVSEDGAMLNQSKVPFYAKYEATAVNSNFQPLSFVHVLKSSAELSSHLIDVVGIPQMACAKAGIEFVDVILARMFVTTPHEYDKDYYEKHTDMDQPHTVCIYYVNDAVGDTYFFDGDNIVKQVSPKKGRVILFNGLIEHAGGVAKEGPRCIINFGLWTN
jgi:hypothetical protein